MDALWMKLGDSLGLVLAWPPEVAEPTLLTSPVPSNAYAPFSSNATRARDIRLRAWPGFVEQMRGPEAALSSCYSSKGLASSRRPGG